MKLCHNAKKERRTSRREELRPLINQLYTYIGSIPAVPKSKKRIFEDGRLELTNNQSERFVKELVMGRKNYLFSTSLIGAQRSGYILSVLKTAELNGLNSQKYLEYLFEELPNLPVLTTNHLDEYLPWSKMVQEKCK